MSEFDHWWNSVQPIHVGGPIRAMLRAAFEAGVAAERKRIEANLEQAMESWRVIPRGERRGG